MEACVQWYEGMLISPQHFQQSENYLQHLFREFSSAHSAFGYGVYDLKIDTSALASGVIRVLNARGIFKDGLFFDFDALHDKPLERNLSDYFAVNSTPVKIYLAAPARKTGENQLTGDMARYYSSEVSNVCDENTGENPINISTLKPQMKLLMENEIDARYTYFPIFEAQKSVDGGVVSTDYIAPYITINEHSKISEMCREVAQIIRGKVSYFADRKDNYSRTASEGSMASLRALIQAALPL
ncbi:MAG: type VI secretion system baseplate subunit TssK, partial [Alphaproteobacteria bacterium]|nr:type VI secretion system baseplate subunit TssK [Alphaproteobacteria bacterium]